MRLLMISHQVLAQHSHVGLRETYEAMVEAGELDSFQFVKPLATSLSEGHEASLAELTRASEAGRPDVIIVTTPNGFNQEPGWIREFLKRSGDPTVLYWEEDPWQRWAKPINECMRAWLAASDVVFTTAREPHDSLFRRAGAPDIRFRPQTYCQVTFSEAERTDPLDAVPSLDVVVIGNRLSRRGGISRIPGAGARARLVKGLQRTTDLRLAIHGWGWSGGGALGELPYERLAGAIRAGRVSANWDHFPRHVGYTSDRFPISMIAGRAHVTTRHPGSDWMPGEEAGVFQERSPSAARDRVRELVAMADDDLLPLGQRGHRWVRDRLSNRQSARFMLAALDRSLLGGLPEDPWLRLSREWPES